jgi:hypothetical protein
MRAEALASVITDEMYVPTNNQTTAARGKGGRGGGMREDMVGKMEDVVGDHLPVGKMERIANSVHDIPREALKVSKVVVSLAARGKASAAARSADRPMLRRTQATGREEDIVKGSARMGGGRDAEISLNKGGLKENESPAYSTQAKAYIWGNRPKVEAN